MKLNGFQIISELGMGSLSRKAFYKKTHRGKRTKVCPKGKVFGTKCFYKFG